MPREAIYAINQSLAFHQRENRLTVDVIADKRHLAEAFRLQKRLSEAETTYRECIADCAHCGGSELEYAKSFMGLGQILMDEGDLESADSALTSALKHFELRPSSQRFWYGRCLLSLARLRFLQNNPMLAKTTLEDGLSVIEPLIGPGHPLRIKALKGMGKLLESEGSSEDSRKLFAECEHIERILKDHDF